MFPWNFDKYVIDIKECEKKEFIGKGRFSEIFTVKYKGYSYAAKKFYDDLDKYPRQFLNKLKNNLIMLAEIKNRMICSIEGYSLRDFEDERHLIFFNTYIVRGSLNKYLFLPKKLTPTKKIINIYGIASGLSYLHSKDIIHGNINPNNILENFNFQPKICDFERYQIQLKKEDHFNIGKNLIYTPPEILKGEEYTKSSDVYSYGIMIYEILTNTKPFQDLTTFELVTKIVNGERPQIPKEIPKCYRLLIKKCWSQNPDDRPSFDEIVDMIKNNDEFIESIGAKRRKFFCYVNDEDYISNVPRQDKGAVGESRNMPSSPRQDIQKDAVGGDSDSDKEIKIPKDAKGGDSDSGEERNKPSSPPRDMPLDAKDSIDDLSLKMNIESIDLNNYEKKKKIGEGNYANAYKIVDKKTGITYAAKISKKELDEELKKINDCDVINITKEVNILLKMDHPSIIKFIGYSGYDFKKRFKPTIITEFVKNGSLDHILEMEEKSLADDSWNDTKKLINIYGIASAMSYLHQHNILHIDLKAANILVDENMSPKLSDFGLSEDLSEKDDKDCFEEKSGCFKGTPTHLAPEIFNESKYSKASDVYAFGFTVFEIMTNEKPFNKISGIYQLIMEVASKKRPKINSDLPSCYKKLIEDCWAQNPDDRPTFNQILSSLKNNKDFVNKLNIDENEYLEYINLIDSFYNPVPFVESKKMIEKEPIKKAKLKSRSLSYWKKSLIKSKKKVDENENDEKVEDS